MVEPPALLTASAALNAFHVPVVAVTPGFYARWSPDMKNKYCSVFEEKTPNTKTRAHIWSRNLMSPYFIIIILVIQIILVILITLIILIITTNSVGGRHRQNILTTAPDLAGQARSERIFYNILEDNGRVTKTFWIWNILKAEKYPK